MIFKNNIFFNKENILPKHVSIITDGNGRWAVNKKLPRYIGHVYGGKVIKKIIDYSKKIGIKYLSLYIFSKENWKRSNEEINILMNLLEKYLTEFIMSKINKGILLKIIGDYNNLPQKIIQLIEINKKKSVNDYKITVILCINYSGREELLNAFKQIIIKKVDFNNINEKLVQKYLYTSDIPNPDLIIRTSGEIRLSNFLIWQSIYSELYFTNILWPDFTINDFQNSLIEYSKRSRRFGGI